MTTQTAVAPPRRRMTIDEYLRFEFDAEYKHEYANGEIIDMAGSTGEHSLIASNLGGELGNALKGKPCRVYDSNLRVRIHNKAYYNYPDLQVICGEIQYDPDDHHHMSALNPRLIVEVISPSTEAYVRGEKFRRYREIPSLREYVLVSQSEALVEIFFRQEDGTWALATFQGIESNACFRALEVAVPMAEIFTGVTFAVPKETDAADDEPSEADEPREQ